MANVSLSLLFPITLDIIWVIQVYTRKDPTRPVVGCGYFNQNYVPALWLMKTALILALFLPALLIMSQWWLIIKTGKEKTVKIINATAAGSSNSLRAESALSGDDMYVTAAAIVVVIDLIGLYPQREGV